MKSFPDRLTDLELQSKINSEKSNSLEAAVEEQTKVISALVNNTKQAFTSTREAIDGVMSALKEVMPEFESKFEEAVRKMRKVQEDRVHAQEKAQIQQLLDTKQLVSVEKVSEETVILTGKLKDKEGVVTNEFVMVQLPALSGDLVEQFLGQGVGFVHTDPESGANFLVEQIINTPPKKEAQLKAE